MTRRLIIAAAVLALCAGARGDEWSQMIGQNDQVTQGLVAYWSMRNSGATVFDERGGYNGVATNGVAFGYQMGAVGDGANFDGTNDYIFVLANAAFNPGTNNFSVSFWVLRGQAHNYQHIFDNRGTGGYSIFTSIESANPFAFYDADANMYTRAKYIVWTDSAWHHIVFVRTGAAGAFWIDATNQTLSTDNISGDIGGTGNEIRIGTTVSTTGRYWSGKIDEVRYYNRALSADEIRQLYRMGATPRRIKE